MSTTHTESKRSRVARWLSTKSQTLALRSSRSGGKGTDDLNTTQKSAGSNQAACTCHRSDSTDFRPNFAQFGSPDTNNGPRSQPTTEVPTTVFNQMCISAGDDQQALFVRGPKILFQEADKLLLSNIASLCADYVSNNSTALAKQLRSKVWPEQPQQKWHDEQQRLSQQLLCSTTALCSAVDLDRGTGPSKDKTSRIPQHLRQMSRDHQVVSRVANYLSGSVYPFRPVDEYNVAAVLMDNWVQEGYWHDEPPQYSTPWSDLENDKRTRDIACWGTSSRWDSATDLDKDIANALVGCLHPTIGSRSSNRDSHKAETDSHAQ